MRPPAQRAAIGPGTISRLVARTRRAGPRPRFAEGPPTDRRKRPTAAGGGGGGGIQVGRFRVGLVCERRISRGRGLTARSVRVLTVRAAAMPAFRARAHGCARALVRVRAPRARPRTQAHERVTAHADAHTSRTEAQAHARTHKARAPARRPLPARLHPRTLPNARRRSRAAQARTPADQKYGFRAIGAMAPSPSALALLGGRSRQSHCKPTRPVSEAIARAERVGRRRPRQARALASSQAGTAHARALGGHRCIARTARRACRALAASACVRALESARARAPARVRKGPRSGECALIDRGGRPTSRLGGPVQRAPARRFQVL